MIHMFGVGSCRRILTQYREVSGDLAIEQRHLLQLGARKLAQSASIGLCKQRSQTVPVGPPLRYPQVGEDLCHGTEF